MKFNFYIGMNLIWDWIEWVVVEGRFSGFRREGICVKLGTFAFY